MVVRGRAYHRRIVDGLGHGGVLVSKMTLRSSVRIAAGSFDESLGDGTCASETVRSRRVGACASAE
jgi:hypothetical protein